jgi:hypothetical protein
MHYSKGGWNSEAFRQQYVRKKQGQLYFGKIYIQCLLFLVSICCFVVVIVVVVVVVAIVVVVVAIVVVVAAAAATTEAAVYCSWNSSFLAYLHLFIECLCMMFRVVPIFSFCK